jgi:anti-sigma factor RsiW
LRAERNSRLEMSEKDHRLEDALAYRQGFLEGDELAAFEAHLKECPECQATLERVSKFLPALQQALTMEERESDVEVLAAVRAAAGAAEASAKAVVKASGPARRYQRRWAIPAAVALGASAAVFFVLVQPRGGAGPDTIAHQPGEDAGPEKRVFAAPHPPPRPKASDAGPDGGVGEDGIEREP